MCCHMEEPQKYYAKWKSQTQKTICCMIWLIFPERSHLWEIANQSLHKSGSGDWPQSGQKEFWLWWGGVINILKWHCGGLHNSKNLLKNYWTVHLQRVNFIICKVYLNKDVKTTTTTKTKETLKDRYIFKTKKVAWISWMVYSIFV